MTTPLRAFAPSRAPQNLYQLQNRWDDQRARDRLEPILQDVRRQARQDLRHGPLAFAALTICTLAAAALSRGLGA